MKVPVDAALQSGIWRPARYLVQFKSCSVKATCGFLVYSREWPSSGEESLSAVIFRYNYDIYYVFCLYC